MKSKFLGLLASVFGVAAKNTKTQALANVFSNQPRHGSAGGYAYPVSPGRNNGFKQNRRQELKASARRKHKRSRR